jgi:hypothetical protein
MHAMWLRLVKIAVVVVIVGGWVAQGQADEPILLKYKTTAGDKLYYKSGLDLKQTQSIAGMKYDNTIKQETIVSQVVSAVGADGKATLKVKADRRKLNAELGPQGKYEFDSKSTERDTTSAVGAPLTPLLERLTGSEYELVLDPRGLVTEVKGYAELIGDLLKNNPFGGQFAAADNKTAAHQEQRGFIVFSEKPVAPGDSWEVPFEVELTNIGKIKGTTTYTYEGPDKVGDRKTVRIGVASNISLEMSIDQGTAKVSGTLSTTSSTGTAQFDPEAGRIVSMKQTSGLSGKLTVEAGGMMFPVDNDQEQTETHELLDKLPE